MIEIIEAIDDYTNTDFTTYNGKTLNVKTWGFCELVKRTTKGNEQPIPMTCVPTGIDRKQVALDDTKDLITWVRWVDTIGYEPNVQYSFGRSTAYETTLVLRVIVAHKVTLGERLIFDFVKNFPDDVDADGFRFINVNGKTIDPDHENIYLTELGDNSYEKHRFPWNIYAVNVTVNFIECLV